MLGEGRYVTRYSVPPHAVNGKTYHLAHLLQMDEKLSWKSRHLIIVKSGRDFLALIPVLVPLENKSPPGRYNFT
jgi:hypothetical protein